SDRTREIDGDTRMQPARRLSDASCLTRYRENLSVYFRLHFVAGGSDGCFNTIGTFIPSFLVQNIGALSHNCCSQRLASDIDRSTAHVDDRFNGQEQTHAS